MTHLPQVSRRKFVVGSAAAAGGLALGFNVPFAKEAEAAAVAAAPVREVNAWVVIHPDDTVVVRIAKHEMGQGTITGLAQLVAEELECDWSKVTYEYPTPGENLKRKRVWGDMMTAGSMGIRASQDYLRQGAAAAREMLIAAAAKQWNVPAGECTAANSVITHKGTGRTVTFGKVATAAASMKVPEKIPLKDPKDWKIAGKPVARLDTPDKLTGKQLYGIDYTMPGMLNAAVRDCPVFGGKVASFNAAAVENMPGVKKVVPVGETGVAVIADTWWHAHSALMALPVEWDNGPNAGLSTESFAAELKEGLTAETKLVDTNVGDTPAAIKGAAKTYTATYSYPWQNHAAMEPLNATALWTPEKCEVWTGTQNGEASLAVAAEAAGIPVQNCEVHRMLIGGGFGRRAAHQDYVTQAVLIAKQMPGVPVKMIWSREEDMLHGRFHPSTQCKMTAAIDASGNVTGVHMRLSGQSIVAAVYPGMMSNGKDPLMFQGLSTTNPDGLLGYTFPNLLIDHAMRNPAVPPGFWRGVNLNQNAFYFESFMDELARELGQDPLAFRRKFMKDHPKHLAVLEAVAKAIGWEDTKPAPGVGRGLAQTKDFGSNVAAAAEVTMVDGKLKILRIVAATDCGHAVNPAQIERQIEGSFAFGLSSVLLAECTMKDGRMERDNFHTYNVMRMAGMPHVESIIMPSGGFWGGVGEPTIAVAGPAVLNALASLTGKRVRDLPLAKSNMQIA